MFALLFDVPPIYHIAMVDFLVAFCVAYFEKFLDEIVIDVNFGFFSVAVGSGEYHAVVVLFDLLYCDVAETSVP